MTQSSPQPKRRRAPQTGLFKAVADELRARFGTLQNVARESGVSYDTVLSILHNEADVGICKVQRLAQYLGVRVLVKGPKRAAPPSGEG